MIKNTKPGLTNQYNLADVIASVIELEHTVAEQESFIQVLQHCTPEQIAKIDMANNTVASVLVLVKGLQLVIRDQQQQIDRLTTLASVIGHKVLTQDELYVLAKELSGDH